MYMEGASSDTSDPVCLVGHLTALDFKGYNLSVSLSAKWG